MDRFPEHAFSDTVRRTETFTFDTELLMAAKLTTKQKRDRRLKIKRRKLRRLKRGL